MSCDDNTCSKELGTVPVVTGCPEDNVYFIVTNWVGGYGSYKYARVTWAQLQSCFKSPANSLRLIVGEAGAPIAGASTYQNDKLIGLDDLNNRISMKISGQWEDSWGDNQSFNYDSITGIIDVSPNIFIDESAVEIPLLKSVL